MAIDVCSEISSAGISPRISFSHDLNQDSISIQDCLPRLDASLLDSDFHFCIGPTKVQELSSADELFSNGKILPIQIKKQPFFISGKQNDHQPNYPVAHNNSPPSKRTTTSDTAAEKKLLKEFLSVSIDGDEKPAASKSFWQFKRSNSLNCDTSKSKGLIRSLQFLSRSNSTGSAPNPPKQPLLFSNKENHHKPKLQKQHSVPSRRSPAAASYGAYYSGQKSPPTLRKCGSYHGSGVRISPILNIPPPYISRGTVNLFGLGSLFCNGKVKKKKK